VLLEPRIGLSGSGSCNDTPAALWRTEPLEPRPGKQQQQYQPE